MDEQRVVRASRVLPTAPEEIFEQIADPARQPAWDGNDNLAHAEEGQRVRRVGDVFIMTTTKGRERHNHVVEFEEGRLIAWRPAEPGKEPAGHLWRWELRPRPEGTTEVVHTCDWTELTDPGRLARARSTDEESLLASIDRLSALLA